jgi:AcrR family transcriptional regulator
LRRKSTRGRLLDAAYQIILEDSLSNLSIERVSARAGLSRRTFFLHFNSKDQLLAEVLAHVRPAFAEDCRAWSDALRAELTAEQRLEELLRRLVAEITDPGWKGGCFLRISAEFGDRPGHPAHAVVAESHRDLEFWLEGELARGGFANAAGLARQLTLLVNGLLVMQLVHRNAVYGETALSMVRDVLVSGRRETHREEQRAAEA